MQKVTARSELIRSGNVRPVGNLVALFIAQATKRDTAMDAINARRAELHRAPVRKTTRVG